MNFRVVEPEADGASDASPRILVVDDEAYVRDVLIRWLRKEGYECVEVGTGAEAWEQIETGEYELVLLDIRLPDISGVDILERVREELPDTAVIMVTGVDDRETGLRCMQLGAQGYVLKPFDEREVLINVDGALEGRRREIQNRTYQARLENEVRSRTEELRRREEEIALRLVAAAEYRDEETKGHIRRIGMFGEALARAMGWDGDQIDNIRVAAPMHDIGKIGIPDGILLKSGKLTPQEFEVVKLHTTIGAEMLADSDIPVLQMAHDIALSHHERWDGAGYPERLVAEEIPLPARLVAIADVYDALTHDRAHRPAFAQDEALALMQQGRDKHFDPEVFDVFLEILPAFQRITQQVAEESR